MADLLECLIQIKGVAATPGRLAGRVAEAVNSGREADARRVAGRLAAAEARFLDCLSRMLAEDRASLPPLDLSGLETAPGRSLEDSVREFEARRAALVSVLDGCSAADLNRVGLEASRRAMTVADLVAMVLAHDTDQLGLLINSSRSN